MRSFHQPVGNNSFHCLQFGSGNALLVAFHGFGDDASSFKAVEPSLGKKFKIVSVDLPFHGQTNWNKDDHFSPEVAWQLVDALMLQHGVSTVSFAAFSIGGKIALKLFETRPTKVDSLWLFAPDGLKNNVWYNLAVYPAWGRKLFRFLLNRPKLLTTVIGICKRLGVIPKSFAQFLESSLQRPEARERVWNTWLGIRGFEVPYKRLQTLLRAGKTTCHIVMGKHDAVIKPYVGQRFVSDIPNAHLHVIPKGHYLLKPYLNEAIERILHR